MSPGGFRIVPDDEKDRDYEYGDGVYRVIVNGQTWEVDEDTISEIQHQYSYEGGNLTQQEISVTYDIPRKILEIVLRKLGVFKASPAWTRERLEAVEDPTEYEDLANATYEARSHSYQAKQMRLELREMRKELNQYRDQEYREKKQREALTTALQEMPDSWRAPAKPKRKVRVRNGKVVNEPSYWSIHAPVVDLHSGKMAYGSQDMGEDYDLDVSLYRLARHGMWLADRIERRATGCVCFLTDLGDLIHSLRGKTDSGTELGTDSRDKKVFRETIAAKVEQIEAIRAVAERVEVVGIEGNHASFADWALTEALKIRYEAASDVNIRTTYKPQSYFLWGESLHILDHGKGVGKLTAWKAQAQLDVVARETTGDDFAKGKQLYYYVGHIHELQVGSLGKHAQLIRLPSFGESDAYESSLRYASLPVAHAFVLDDKGRISEEWRHYFND